MCVFPLSSTPGSLPRWGSACQARRGCDEENDNIDDNVEEMKDDGTHLHNPVVDVDVDVDDVDVDDVDVDDVDDR